MGSHFSSTAKRRKTPSWCKPGMYTGLAPMVAGRPAGLNVYVKWFDDISSEQFHMLETFHLYRYGASSGWKGSSSPTHPRLIVDVSDRPSLIRYDVKIEVDIWGWITDSWTFHNVRSDFRPPWGTALTAHVWVPYRRLLTFQILG